MKNNTYLFCCNGNQLRRRYNTYPLVDLPSVDSELEHREDAISASVNGESEVVLLEKQKAKSAVWTFFSYKLDSNGKPIDESKPVFKFCRGEVAVKGGNTTNLFSHLKHQHPKQYSELQLNKDPRQCNQIGSSSSQPTIQQAFANSQKYSRNSKR